MLARPQDSIIALVVFSSVSSSGCTYNTRGYVEYRSQTIDGGHTAPYGSTDEDSHCAHYHIENSPGSCEGGEDGRRGKSSVVAERNLGAAVQGMAEVAGIVNVDPYTDRKSEDNGGECELGGILCVNDGEQHLRRRNHTYLEDPNGD